MTILILTISLERVGIPENSNASSDNIIIVSNDINPDHPGYLLASGQVPEEYKIPEQNGFKKFTTQAGENV